MGLSSLASILANLGIEPNFSPSQVKRMRCLNILLLTAGFWSLAAAIRNFQVMGLAPALYCLLTTLVLWTILLLNYLRYNLLSRTLMGPVSGLLMLTTVILGGTKQGLEYYTPLLISGAYVLFDSHEKAARQFFLIVVSVCSLGIVILTAFSFEGIMMSYTHKSLMQAGIERSINLLASIIISAVLIYNQWTENNRSEFILSEINADIRSIMDNIPIGIFSISRCDDSTGTPLVDNFFSKNLASIVGLNENIAHTDIDSLIFNRSKLDPDTVALSKSIVSASLGQSFLTFDANSSALPHEVTISGIHDEQVLNLRWGVVLARDLDTVSRILVTVENVTQLLVYKRKAEEQRQNVLRMIELVSLDSRKFGKFYTSTRKLLAECHRSVDLAAESKLTADAKALVIKDVCIHLHTIKGNSRSVGLKAISSAVHGAEDVLGTMKSKGFFDHRVVHSILKNIEGILGEYFAISCDQLNRGEDAGETIVLSQSYAALLIDELISKDVIQQQNVVPLLGAVYTSLESVLEDSSNELRRLAKDLGKPMPHVRLKGINGIYFNPHHAEALYNALGHLFRNSLDHGIESGPQRTALGKKAEGTISIEGDIAGDSFILRLTDDGRGLALRTIRQKAQATGLVDENIPLTNQEAAELIFSEGFSTADAVSEISGRGVGMGAVRSILKAIGADLSIEIEEHELEYLPFQLKLQISLQVVRIYPKSGKFATDTLLSVS